jgi:Protein of unknown function (DUF1344)
MRSSFLPFATGIIPLAAALSFIAATAANAADVSGVIKTVNKTQHRVTLDSGKAYEVSATTDLSKYKPGDKVMIQFTPTEPIFQSIGIAGDATAITVEG